MHSAIVKREVKCLEVVRTQDSHRPVSLSECGRLFQAAVETMERSPYVVSQQVENILRMSILL